MQLNKDKQWNNLNAYIKTKATSFKNSLPLKTKRKQQHFEAKIFSWLKRFPKG